MKICYLGDGQSIHIERWMKYFVEQGHQIILLTDNPGNPTPIQQIRVGNRRNYKLIHYYRCIHDIKKILKSFKPDILHAHFISGYGYWAQWSKFHPLVLTAWGSDIYIVPHDKFISKILVRRALEQADLVTADSADLKSAILNLAPRTKRIELISFGVDTSLFKPAVDIEMAKSELKLAGHKVILSNRRLEPLYNLDNIIRATSLIKKEFPNIKLIVFGEGSQNEKLLQLSNSLKLQSNIEFRGSVNHPELAKYLQATDLYISVPQSDATSVSLLEAMACELPMVVSDLPSNREWVEPDINGKLVPPDSVDVLARACVELLQDPLNARTMGKKNRQIILTRAEYKSQMQKMEKLYKEVSGL